MNTLTRIIAGVAGVAIAITLSASPADAAKRHHRHHHKHHHPVVVVTALPTPPQPVVVVPESTTPRRPATGCFQWPNDGQFHPALCSIGPVITP